MEMPPGPPVAGPSPPPTSAADAPEAAPDLAPAPDRTVTAEADNQRLVATIAALALVVVAVMIGAFLLTRDGSEGDAQDVAPASNPPLSIPTATSVVGDALDEAALDALIPELQAVVEEERELEFEEDIDLEVLGDDAYVERAQSDIAADLADSRDELESSAAAFQALGLWAPGTDPVEVLSEFAAGASLGYYDPETGAMVVRGSIDSPNLRITLVHELTHALEDQHFDLDRPELDDAFDESSSAFSALVEGSAQRVEAVYTATLTDEERAAAVQEQTDLIAGLDLEAVPQILIRQQDFTYRGGAAFVDSIFAAGGNAAVNRALRRPPTTSEQILEPEGWPERDAIVDVAVPEADAEPLDEGVVGQFLLHLLAAEGGEDVEPTPEWDGDSAVVWRDGEQACLRMAIAGDTDTFEESLGGWAEQVGAEMALDGELLVVTSCR